MVLIHLKNLGFNQYLSLKDLTLKTIMILALTRLWFADLCLLDVYHFRERPEGISFIPLGLFKQAKGGRFVRKCFFPKFLADESICPVINCQAIYGKDRASPYDRICKKFNLVPVMD